MKKALAPLGIPPEKMVFISGIGCSSRFPYYMNTYGFHSIHGRAPAFATGLKAARPDLTVWVVTGDGDGLSIGGNHLIHAIRRNIDLKIVLFNNEIYGLTKGQYSPTSRQAPRANRRRAARPTIRCGRCQLALGSEATFVARTVDVDIGAPGPRRCVGPRPHKGTALVEVYQNCLIFNDDAFKYASDKSVKPDNMVYLEHGKPMVFGKNRDRGVRLNGLDLEVVQLGNGITEKDLLVHDESAEAPTLAGLLSRMVYPEMPECLGVLRCVERPTFDEQLREQSAAR